MPNERYIFLSFLDICPQFAPELMVARPPDISVPLFRFQN